MIRGAPFEGAEDILPDLCIGFHVRKLRLLSAYDSASSNQKRRRALTQVNADLRMTLTVNHSVCHGGRRPSPQRDATPAPEIPQPVAHHPGLPTLPFQSTRRAPPTVRAPVVSNMSVRESRSEPPTLMRMQRPVARDTPAMNAAGVARMSGLSVAPISTAKPRIAWPEKNHGPIDPVW